MERILSNISCYLDPKVKGQIMYFLVNGCSPTQVDILPSNFAGA